MSGPDPVLARRARIARVVRYGQRAGYGALIVAVVSFVIAAATDPWPRSAPLGASLLHSVSRHDNNASFARWRLGTPLYAGGLYKNPPEILADRCESNQ